MMADLMGRPREFEVSTNAFVAVAQQARKASDRALIASEIVGFAAAIAILAWNPNRLELVLPAVATGALGVWGITDHMIDASGKFVKPLRSLLSAFHFAIAAVGVAAAIATGYVILGRMMGVFIL